MATITLEYNPRNHAAQKFISTIMTLSDLFKIQVTAPTIKKKKDDTLMTKEEYFAMLDKSIQQAKEGKVRTLTPELEIKLFGSVL